MIILFGLETAAPDKFPPSSFPLPNSPSLLQISSMFVSRMLLITTNVYAKVELVQVILKSSSIPLNAPASKMHHHPKTIPKPVHPFSKTKPPMLMLLLFQSVR
jgi:hypothetical protein